MAAIGRALFEVSLRLIGCLSSTVASYAKLEKRSSAGILRRSVAHGEWQSFHGTDFLARAFEWIG